MRIILDCDDVLYKCNITALGLLNDELNTNYKISDITKWGQLGNSLDERIKYFKDELFVRKQDPYDGAKEFVHKLSEIAEIFICTTVPANCLTSRVESILENFPEIPRDNIFLSGRKDILNADIILDDNPQNLLESNCKYPVLFQQPWNRDVSGLISVSTYEAFIELVKSIMNPFNNNQHEIIALIGPSGSGKKDYCKKIISESEGLMKQVLTYSTSNKKNHIHINKDEFEKLEKEGFFIETSCYNGDLYGVRGKDIDDVLNSNKKPILIVDINGALKLKSDYGAELIFISKPKEQCIEKILNKNISNKQKVNLIMSLDIENKNYVFCDKVINMSEVI